MRLINFGPGEIADRLSILALKIHYATLASKPCNHFKEERDQLARMLPGAPGSRVTTQHLIELATLNGINWAQTDRVRLLRENPSNLEATEELAELCIRLQELNDRRAELISLINTNSGHEATQEKV